MRTQNAGWLAPFPSCSESGNAVYWPHGESGEGEFSSGEDNRVLIVLQHLLAASSDKDMCSTTCVLASIQTTLGSFGICPRFQTSEGGDWKECVAGLLRTKAKGGGESYSNQEEMCKWCMKTTV